jgi:hypothetical protein
MEPLLNISSWTFRSGSCFVHSAQSLPTGEVVQRWSGRRAAQFTWDVAVMNRVLLKAMNR